ncbi:MAG TPA: hypothetical protein VGQ41_09400 [Pyrinomonadaceae bacterium]|jgi:hypothetical protein|nr:hypothetical protein [Pyrinomonadaceae bacterium]
MMISFSRYLAVALGVLTPFAETIRRWSTWRADPPALFDDYILGAFLLYGAWRVGQDARTGQRFLAAGFAFMCGMAYYSFFAQLQNLRIGVPDPAPISSSWVAVIKGTGLALGVLGLVLSLRRLPESRN